MMRCFSLYYLLGVIMKEMHPFSESPVFRLSVQRGGRKEGGGTNPASAAGAGRGKAHQEEGEKKTLISWVRNSPHPEKEKGADCSFCRGGPRKREAEKKYLEPLPLTPGEGDLLRSIAPRGGRTQKNPGGKSCEKTKAPKKKKKKKLRQSSDQEQNKGGEQEGLKRRHCVSHHYPTPAGRGRK